VQEGQGFLLVVDQLEEALVFSEGTQEGARHLDALLAIALEDIDSPFHLITTLRSDFLGRFDEELPRLSGFLNARWTSRYYLHTLKAEALRQALVGPAQLAGLHWEEGLPGRIIQDAEAASGGLPLVAHVLQELWKRRGRGGELTHAAYEAIGGVGGALTLSADTLLDTFTEEEQARVRKLLLALVKVGHGTRNVRRTLALSEALEVAGGPEQGHDLLLRLSGGRAPQSPVGVPAPPRLLVVEEERVELIHEALLEQWRTLRDWLEESRSALEQREALEAAARLWMRTRELPGEGQLRYLRSVDPVSDLARTFLGAVSAHEQRLRHFDQSRELAVSALQSLGRDPQLSLQLILEAYRLAPTEQATDGLVKWYLNRQLSLLGDRGAMVSAAAFSPEGQRILTANEDDTLRIWDVTGQMLARFQGYSRLNTVAFSPDGTRILGGSADGTAQLWEAGSGRHLARLGGHAGAVERLAFSADGRHILTASEGGTVRLWSATDGRALRKLRALSKPLRTALFSPDGARILTIEGRGKVVIWATNSGRRLLSLGGRGHLESAAAFSPDGERVLIAEWPGQAFICDSISGQVLVQLQGTAGWVRTIAFSPDGRKVFTGDIQGRCVLWDAQSGELLSQCQVGSEAVLAGMLSPHGQYFLTAHDKGTLHLGDAGSGELLAELHGHSAWAVSAAFSPEGQYLLTTAGDGTARIWEAALNKPRKEFEGWKNLVFSPAGGRLLSLGQLWEVDSGRPVANLREELDASRAIFSSDGRYLFTYSYERKALLWDGRTGQRLTEFQGPTELPSAATFSENGQYLLTGNREGRLHLWSTASGQLLREIGAHTTTEGSQHLSQVTAVGFSPDGTRLLSGGVDHMVRMWDAISGQQLMELRGHIDFITTAMFSPDGQRVLTMSWEWRARLWSAASGRLLAILEAQSGIMRTAAFDASSRRLLTTDEGRTVRLWDAESGSLLTELRGHTDTVFMAGFSPNGRLVLTASRDQTARIWEAASGQLVAVLRGPEGPGFTAAFGADGRIITSNGEGTAYLWECELFLSTEALFERAWARVFRELTEEERKRYLHDE
jgi:WD40 repeat protein